MREGVFCTAFCTTECSLCVCVGGGCECVCCMYMSVHVWCDVYMIRMSVQYIVGVCLHVLMCVHAWCVHECVQYIQVYIVCLHVLMCVYAYMYAVWCTVGVCCYYVGGCGIYHRYTQCCKGSCTTLCYSRE